MELGRGFQSVVASDDFQCGKFWESGDRFYETFPLSDSYRSRLKNGAWTSRNQHESGNDSRIEWREQWRNRICRRFWKNRRRACARSHDRWWFLDEIGRAHV